MKKQVKHYLLLLVITIVSTGSLFAAEKGKPAPDFTFYSTMLKPVNNADLNGSISILAFVPGAFTGVCTQEICTFRDDMAAFEELNADIYIITTDSPFSNAAWGKANEVNFPILSDINHEAIVKFDAYHENFANVAGFFVPKRSIFILDENGIVSYKWVSENPGVLPPFDEIKSHIKSIKG